MTNIGLLSQDDLAEHLEMLMDEESVLIDKLADIRSKIAKAQEALSIDEDAEHRRDYLKSVL